MRVNSIQSNNNTRFGSVILGKGGAVRLAKTMPVEGAKKLIRNNTFLNNDILISHDAVEILPYNKGLILNVSDKIAGSKDFTDIEVFEHGERYIFKVQPGLSEEEINKYGSRNRQISLAEAIAKQLDLCSDWLDAVRTGSRSSGGEIMPAVQNAAKEIDLFNRNYYMFG